MPGSIPISDCCDRISFYTFHSPQLPIDLYRRSIPPRARCSTSLLRLAVPASVAGPILRAGDLLPQIARQRRSSASRPFRPRALPDRLLQEGGDRDNLARFIDPVFADPASQGGPARSG